VSVSNCFSKKQQLTLCDFQHFHATTHIIVKLTNAHTPENPGEAERVQRAGGIIVNETRLGHPGLNYDSEIEVLKFESVEFKVDQSRCHPLTRRCILQTA
jgi:hypothetical protein